MIFGSSARPRRRCSASRTLKTTTRTRKPCAARRRAFSAARKVLPDPAQPAIATRVWRESMSRTLVLLLGQPVEATLLLGELEGERRAELERVREHALE